MNIKAISVVKSQLELDGQSVIAYPHSAMAFDVLLPSFKKENRRAVRAYATVDMIKNTAIRADGLPELIEIEINEKSILPSNASTDDAVEAAKEKIIQWIKRRFRLIVNPEIELVEIVPLFFQHEYIR